MSKRPSKKPLESVPPPPQLDLGLEDTRVLSLRGHLVQIQEYQETGRAADAYNHLGWVIRNLHNL